MTEPDPKTVREIAAEHIRSARGDIGITVELMLIGTILDREELAAWEVAVQQAIRAAVLSWPDERQPAETTGGEQAQDGAAGRVEAWVNRIAAHASDETDTRRIADFRAVLAERKQLRRLLGLGVDREQWDAIAEAEGRRYEGEQTNDTLVGYLAYQRESLRALSSLLQSEVKELEAEREADTRAVAALIEAAVALNLGARLQPALGDLDDRFVDRIAALDDGADGGNRG